MYFLIALALEVQAPSSPAQTVEPAPAVSMERIRRGLEEPPSTITVLSNDPTVPVVFRLEIKERSLPYEHLWEGNYESAHVRPVRGLTHHEFLEQVTPDLFRSTSMYPCCPVLPFINFLRSKSGSNSKEKAAKVRAGIKKEVQAVIDANAAKKKPQPPD